MEAKNRWRVTTSLYPAQYKEYSERDAVHNIVDIILDDAKKGENVTINIIKLLSENKTTEEGVNALLSKEERMADIEYAVKKKTPSRYNIYKFLRDSDKSKDANEIANHIKISNRKTRFMLQKMRNTEEFKTLGFATSKEGNKFFYYIAN